MSQEKIENDSNIPPVVEDSPPWDRSVKILVAMVALVFLAILVTRFTDLILQIVAAGIIAYVLTPVIQFITDQTPLKRGAAILITYLVLASLLLAGAVTLGVNTFKQIANLINSIPQILENIVDWLSTTENVSIGPLNIDVAVIWGSIDWASIGDQLVSTVRPIVFEGGRTVVIVLSSTVQVVTVVLFTFIVSIYLAFEVGRLGGYISSAVYQPGYRLDTERILREFGRIWQAYLRGQIVLAFIIFLAVWASLSILGVQNAFGLGVLSGFLEFLPVVGPFIGTGVAAVFALFQPSNYLGVEPVTYAIIVIGAMIIIQQIENNILVPRIVGGSLDLHPLVVIIGVFIGATLAGIIGAILAAPILATVKLLGTYAWRKMFDLPPFPEPEETTPPNPIAIKRRLVTIRKWFKKPPGNSEPPP